MVFPGVDWEVIAKQISSQSKTGEVDWDEINQIVCNQIRKSQGKRVKKAQKTPAPVIKIRVIHKYIYVPKPGAVKNSRTKKAPKDPSLWMKTPAPTTKGLPRTIPTDPAGIEGYILNYLPVEALALDRRSFNRYSDHHAVRSRLAKSQLALNTLTRLRKLALAREYSRRNRAGKTSGK